MDQTTADSTNDPYDLLKPGKEEHLCGNCLGCACTNGNCMVFCDWDCDCPDYYQPEERPL